VTCSDILKLQWANYDDTHIKFTTQKNTEQIQIQLPSKAQEIIAHYSTSQPNRKKTDFIFPLFRNGVDYSSPAILFKAISSGTAYVNKNLKEIAKKAGIEKHISFHSSRHTWATRALKKGMRIEYVSKLMGHGSLKTTMIYAKIVNSELDKAMDVFN
jgi:integrase/recombinase XerD